LKVVDTTFIIDLLRGNRAAGEKAEALDEAGGAATTAVNLFEITYGVYRSRHIDREQGCPRSRDSSAGWTSSLWMRETPSRRERS